MELATGHFPRIAWSFTGTSTALGYNDRFATTYTASDALLWTKGAHSFKFGGEIRRQETFKYLQNQANMNFHLRHRLYQRRRAACRASSRA
jgi:hypothetical protein